MTQASQMVFSWPSISWAIWLRLLTFIALLTLHSSCSPQHFQLFKKSMQVVSPTSSQEGDLQYERELVAENFLGILPNVNASLQELLGEALRYVGSMVHVGYVHHRRKQAA